jgi:hypothetical protein
MQDYIYVLMMFKTWESFSKKIIEKVNQIQDFNSEESLFNRNSNYHENLEKKVSMQLRRKHYNSLIIASQESHVNLANYKPAKPQDFQKLNSPTFSTEDKLIPIVKLSFRLPPEEENLSEEEEFNLATLNTQIKKHLPPKFFMSERKN